MQKSYFFTILFSMVLGGVLASKADTHLQVGFSEGGPQKEGKLVIQEGPVKTTDSSYSSTIKAALKAHLFSLPKSKLAILGKAGLGVAAAWATLFCGINAGIFHDDWSYVVIPNIAAFLAGGPAGLGASMGVLGGFVAHSYC